MSGDPFTRCQLRRTSGPDIPAGAFLVAQTTAYRVDGVAGRTLHCTRWPLASVPGDAEVFVWHWDRRGRQPSRRSPDEPVAYGRKPG